MHSDVVRLYLIGKDSASNPSGMAQVSIMEISYLIAQYDIGPIILAHIGANVTDKISDIYKILKILILKPLADTKILNTDLLTSIHVCMNVCVYACVCIYLFIHTYIDIYTYLDTHTYTIRT